MTAAIWGPASGGAEQMPLSAWRFLSGARAPASARSRPASTSLVTAIAIPDRPRLARIETNPDTYEAWFRPRTQAEARHSRWEPDLHKAAIAWSTSSSSGARAGFGGGHGDESFAAAHDFRRHRPTLRSPAGGRCRSVGRALDIARARAENERSQPSSRSASTPIVICSARRPSPSPLTRPMSSQLEAVDPSGRARALGQASRRAGDSRVAPRSSCDARDAARHSDQGRACGGRGQGDTETMVAVIISDGGPFFATRGSGGTWPIGG